MFFKLKDGCRTRGHTAALVKGRDRKVLIFIEDDKWMEQTVKSWYECKQCLLPSGNWMTEEERRNELDLWTTFVQCFDTFA